MTVASPLRSPLKLVGGKYASAARIVNAFPPHQSYDIYLEPCGGAAHVLLRKPQWGHREIYNDLNDDLCNFWLQVQSHADLLVERLQALPYSRKVYYDYYRQLFDGSVIDPLERAVMWFYVLRGTGTGWIRESPVGWNNTQGSANAYRSVLDVFPLVQARLTQPAVIIDNRDVERVIAEYDSPTTLHYVDPPYIGAEYYYQAGIRKQGRKVLDHQRLATLLNAVRGYVALSYYPHPDLDEWYPREKWRRLTWQQIKPSSLVEEEIQVATEMLLCNYPGATPAMSCQSLWEESEAAQ
jgi:DNA adenine methylase